MDPRVVALVVVSALLHALWNAALKKQPDPEGALGRRLRSTRVATV
jgi:hypothetical protein